MAGQRQGALEPGRSGADDGDASCGRAATHDERCGGPALGPGRSEVGVDGAEQDRVERAAVLVAGHARTDLRSPPGEQLTRHVRIGDQCARHADEVRAGGQRGFDRVRRAERVRDQQRRADQLPDPADVAEQRWLLGRHVAHVGRAHAHREVHVIDERVHGREQLAQSVDGQARLAAPVRREPDADHHLRQRGTDLAHDALDDGQPRVGRLGTGPAVRRRRQELGQQIAVRGVQLDDLEPGRGRVDRRAAEPFDDRVELAAAQRARTRRLARRAHGRRGHGGEPLLGAGRLAAEVHELARRDRAFGPDRLRASGHARHGLGPPRLGGDPPPPRRLRGHDGTADGQHRRAAGRPPAPVLGVLRERQPVLEDPARVRRAHEPVAERHVGESEWFGGAHRPRQPCGPRPPISAR